jgi:hypothetical protein
LGAPKSNPLLIHIAIPGGAHSPMGLNPLLLSDLYRRQVDPVPVDNSEFYPTYRDDQLIRTSNHLLGVAADPLVSVSDDISIINGITMLANAPIHESNEAFMNSGDENLKDAEFAAQMMRLFDASTFGLAVSTNSFGGSGSQQFDQSVPLSDFDNRGDLSQLVILMQANAQITGGDSALQKIKAKFSRVAAQYDRYDQVKKRMPQLQGDSAWISTLLPALSADLVNYAYIPIGGFSVDTHNSHDTVQKTAQRSVWTDVAQFIKLAKSLPDGRGSLFDRMAILVTTEFARTSYEAGNDGTDHNPHNNSALVSGGLLRGGLTVGQSTVIPSARLESTGSSNGRSRLQALAFDFGNSRPLSYVDTIDFLVSSDQRPRTENGQLSTDLIFPGNVLRTVAVAMGLEPVGKLRKYNVLQPLLRKV